MKVKVDESYLLNTDEMEVLYEIMSYNSRKYYHDSEFGFEYSTMDPCRCNESEFNSIMNSLHKKRYITIGLVDRNVYYIKLSREI